MKKIDKTGEKFGKLTVIETLYNYNGYNRATCRCLCDCGNEIFIKSAQLNKTNSCGCSRYKDYTNQKFGKLLVNEMLYNYKNNQTYCKCDCDCGKHEYITRMCGLLDGNTTSCGCIHSPSLLNHKFGRLTVVDEIGSHKKQRRWKCICDCGQIRYIDSYTLTSGHTTSCGCIRSEKVSIMEKFISDILILNDIDFITEKSFDDCIGCNNWKLRFDFYLPDLNTTIEYNGMQHYKPIEYFGGYKKFETLQTNDNIKKEYCIKKEINLICLPYTLSNKEIEEILSQIIKMFKNPVTTTVI